MKWLTGYYSRNPLAFTVLLLVIGVVTIFIDSMFRYGVNLVNVGVVSIVSVGYIIHMALIKIRIDKLNKDD